MIGASGQLGSDLIDAFAGLDAAGVDHAMVDIEDAGSVAAMLAHHRPSLVVNTAAYHNVERCETHAARAFAVNTIAVGGLASVCDVANVALAHISTDYVFDGRSMSPYSESATPRPLNVYGISKYAGELAMSARTKRAFIFRTSGLYGRRGSSTKGYTFVERIREQARSGTAIRVVDDVTSTPSSTKDVAAMIRAVLETGTFGTYHVTNAGSCTWYDFAAAILAESGFDVPISAVKSSAFPSYVKRPAYSVLGHEAMDRLGLTPPQDWRGALRSYLRSFEASRNRSL